MTCSPARTRSAAATAPPSPCRPPARPRRRDSFRRVARARPPCGAASRGRSPGRSCGDPRERWDELCLEALAYLPVATAPWSDSPQLGGEGDHVATAPAAVALPSGRPSERARTLVGVQTRRRVGVEGTGRLVV